jgi:hypothetical protein
MRAIDPLNTGEKHTRLLRGSSPINPTCWHGIWGLLERRVYDPQNGRGHGDGGWLLLTIGHRSLGTCVSINLQWELYRFSYIMHS